MASSLNKYDSSRKIDFRSILQNSRESKATPIMQAAVLSEPYSTLDRVSVSIIKWPEYQREFYENRVRRMVGDWRPLDVNHLILSLRENGEYYCIDGWHRKTAIERLKGRVPQEVDAIVWHGLSVMQEAEKFYRTQAPENRKALIPDEIHHAALQAGESQALRIQAILDATGFRVGKAGGDDSTVRINALKHLKDVEARYGPEVLLTALTFIMTTWSSKTSPQSALITGAAMFFSMFPQAKARDVRKRPAKTQLDDWLRDAKTRAGTLKLSQPEGVASLMHDDYNRTVRSNHLPEFASTLREHKVAIRLQANRANAVVARMAKTDARLARLEGRK